VSVSFKSKSVSPRADTNARMFTPVAWKGTDDQMHTLWKAEKRVPEGTAQPQNDGARKGRVHIRSSVPKGFYCLLGNRPSGRSVGTFEKAAQSSYPKAERRNRSKAEERLRVPRQNDRLR